MKLSSLFESYEISYDAGKKKNHSSVVDFIKYNDISVEDIAKALDAAKDLPEFKALIGEYKLTYKSSKLQEKRGTAFFESEDGNRQYTCYITAQARMASRGGFSSTEFRAQPIPTLEPSQIGDKPAVVDVLVDNLKKSFQAVINRFKSAEARGEKGLASVEKRMEKFGFPPGFKIYVTGSENASGYMVMDEGHIFIDAKADNKAFGRITIDFGDHAELDDRVTIGGVSNLWRLEIKGKKIKSYKNLEKFFQNAPTVIAINAEDANFKEMAKVLTAKVPHLMFITNPLEMPILSVDKVAYQKVAFDSAAPFTFSKNKNVMNIMKAMNDMIHGKIDKLELQDELIDAGFTEAAKL